MERIVPSSPVEFVAPTTTVLDFAPRRPTTLPDWVVR